MLFGSAVISEDQLYRYSLTRGPAKGKKLVVIMLNPSTADADVDDPTIIRCLHRMIDTGCKRMEVVNLFAYRATNPKELSRARDPIGPLNDEYIKKALLDPETEAALCGWGTVAKLVSIERIKQVEDIIAECGVRRCCLGKTLDGSPRHPLYVPYKQRIINWY